MQESGLHRRKPECTLGHRYAHIPFINQIINAYRRTTADAFAMEVTEWDVPTWFASFGERIKSIFLIPYFDLDTLPQVVSLKEGTCKPLHLSSAEKLQTALTVADTPGEIELL